MWLLRGLGASLLWILAGVLGLLGAVLCVTVVLLPLGIPLLMLARKLFGYSMVVMVPGKVRHPAHHAQASAKSGLKNAFSSAKSAQKSSQKTAQKTGKSLGRKARKLGKSLAR